MINLLKKVFGKAADGGATDNEQDLHHDIRVATCALLLEMSHIDGEFSEIERENIISILKKDYHLSDEHAARFIAASEQELKTSTDLWQFTNLINQSYSFQEKTDVIEAIWKIAYTDGKLDKHEDYLVHKLATLLHVSHKQLIEAKLKARDSMSGTVKSE
ncbi:MAG: TerB family tellurite resistance protein [Thermodesulfobacteriota bacterium]|nr:TerB family tellurite resistance protein [Thermodesulfobacteriota bacterium]